MTLRQPKRRASEHRLHRVRRRRVAQSGPALLNTAVNTEIRSLHGKHQSKTRDGSHYFCTKQRFTSTDSRASEPRIQRASGALAAPRNSNQSNRRERFPYPTPSATVFSSAIMIADVYGAMSNSQTRAHTRWKSNRVNWIVHVQIRQTTDA